PLLFLQERNTFLLRLFSLLRDILRRRDDRDFSRFNSVVDLLGLPVDTTKGEAIETWRVGCDDRPGGAGDNRCLRGDGEGVPVLPFQRGHQRVRRDGLKSGEVREMNGKRGLLAHHEGRELDKKFGMVGPLSNASGLLGRLGVLNWW